MASTDRAPRQIEDVIDRMLEAIPMTALGLRRELVALQDSARYTAPEMMRERWKHGGAILAMWFGPVVPTEGWTAKVVRIWTGQE